MSKLGQILSKTFFWSYERGTWQYDVSVILIVLFVLATPRHLFRDQPESGARAEPDRVQLISHEGNRLTYRVDARIVAPPKLALQTDLHTALQQALPELQNGRFSITRIETVHDDQGMTVAYQVEVRE